MPRRVMLCNRYFPASRKFKLFAVDDGLLYRYRVPTGLLAVVYILFTCSRSFLTRTMWLKIQFCGPS